MTNVISHLRELLAATDSALAALERAGKEGVGDE